MVRYKRIAEIAWSASCLVRTGWMQRGVPPSMGETVAIHSFSASLIAYEMALELKEQGIELDPEKAALIALYHDLPEVIVGDLPKWSTDRANYVKEALEKEAIGALRKWMKGIDLAEEYMIKSKEAIVAKLAEIISTYYQAERYVKMGMTRVEEIMVTMRESAWKAVAKAEKIDPKLGKAMREILIKEGL
ncbi:phosphohydrolase [Ignicoccus pacificus DSM 13166]|uniref:Phosphohydrolase n=1 Tax=Ignicoccus pacificus DSM 13166 TaxID=940294 RepID=A0A977PJS2_9CREN|nr:phosphohydrolase [Ignicoccus pacificus DSM 13166]